MLLQAVEEFADALGLQPSLRYRLGLVVDELVLEPASSTAPPGEERGIRVGITTAERTSRSRSSIPAALRSPSTPTGNGCMKGTSESAALGLCLVRNLASGMGYVRQDGMNRTRVTLAKNIQENTCTSTK